MNNIFTQAIKDKINDIVYIFSKDTVDTMVTTCFSNLTSKFTKEITSRSSEAVQELEQFLYKIDPIEFNKHAYRPSGSRYLLDPTLKAHTCYSLLLPQKVVAVIRKINEYNLTILLIGKKEALDHTTEVMNAFLSGGLHEDSASEGIRYVHTTMARFTDTGDIKFSSWKRTPIKSIAEIITAQENKDKITHYLNKWIDSEELFEKLGINHKVGILLYGPPGTGKTSMAKYIASMLKTDLVTVDISNFPSQVPDLTPIEDKIDDSVCVVLFEDIDYLFKDIDGNQAKINAMLQTMDGTGSNKNFVYIATTNDIDSLNAAMIRDGRFDLKIFMDNILDLEQAKNLCKVLTLSKEQTEEVLKNIDIPINPATLQNLCIQRLFKDTNEENKIHDRSKSAGESIEQRLDCYL